MAEDKLPRVSIALSSRLLWSGGVTDAATAAWRLGYQGLEIWTEHLWRDGRRQGLRRDLLHLPLRYVLHGPFMDLNLCSRNPRVARLSVAENIRALSWARLLGASLMVVHPGRLSSAKDDPEDCWPLLVEALGVLERRAIMMGVTLAVENMEPRRREFVITPEDVQRVLRSLESGRTEVCLDLAHAALQGPDGPSAFVQALGPRIRHVHMSNVAGGRAHLPLDQGTSPLTPDVLRFLRREFSGAITVEGATPPGIHTAEVGLTSLTALLDGGEEVRAGTNCGEKETRQGSVTCYHL